MIKLKLKDGSVREIEKAMPASEIIKDIGMGLYKAACCVKLDGEVFDMRTVVDHDCHFEVMTFDSKAGKETFWHTASHLMAQAVKNLYPEAKLARGPATDTGFYYDFEVEKPFTPAAFLIILSILSLGTLFDLAFAIRSLSFALPAGSAPPCLTTTAISLPIFVNILALAASVAPFFLLMFSHFE